jgi:hypothetical protein
MRGINRAASALLGLLLVVVGLLVALEAAWIAAGRAPLWFALDRWYGSLTRTTLAATAFLVTSIVVGVVGLAILLLQLRPWRPDRLVAGGTQQWWLRRRSVERRAATMAATVEGVGHPRARATGRPDRWHLILAADAWPDRQDAVNHAVRDELHRLDVNDRTDLQVVLHKPARRVV